GPSPPRETSRSPVRAELQRGLADYDLHGLPRDEQRQSILFGPGRDRNVVHGYGPLQWPAILLRGDGRQRPRGEPAVERSLRETCDRPGRSGQPPGHPWERERDDPMVGCPEQRSARDELSSVSGDDVRTDVAAQDIGRRGYVHRHRSHEWRE